MYVIRAALTSSLLLVAAVIFAPVFVPCAMAIAVPGSEAFAVSALNLPGPVGGYGLTQSGQEDGAKPAEIPEDSTEKAQPDEVPKGPGFPDVSVDEKLGEIAWLDKTFLTEDGEAVKLVDLVDRPTLFLPVYYCCPTACIVMLGSLFKLVNDVPLELGEDYRILIVSFDHDETPADAKKAKENYTAVVDKAFPPESVRFMTGKLEDITAVMYSIGYHYRYFEKHAYQHPNAMLSLAPGGKIIRYLYGPDFLAFDIGMALTEAAKGTPSLSIRKLLTYCFDYNPETKTYTFSAIRYIVIAVLAVLGITLFLLLRRKPQKA